MSTMNIMQEDKEWDLTEEMVADLKEIFILFDKDTDGVLTIEQVYQAMNVMGMKRPGNITAEKIKIINKRILV